MNTTRARRTNPPPAPVAKPVEGTIVDPEAEAIRSQMKKLAWLMDEAFEIPGLGVRIGVDGLLGLIPGVGDLISAGVSTYIISSARQLGVPKVILARMAVNTLIDLALGSIPIVGDIFDIGWKANKRNLHLALQYESRKKRVTTTSWLAIGGLLAVLLLAAVGSVAVVAAILVAIFA